MFNPVSPKLDVVQMEETQLRFWRENEIFHKCDQQRQGGLEYVFYEAPISIGLEVKPYFDLFGREVFHVQLFDFAFTVKYLF